MNELTYMWESFYRILPSLIGGILLVLAAWIVAKLIKKGVTKGLNAVGFDRHLIKWGAVQSETESEETINMLGQVAYYLTWVLFLPGIFEVFNLNTVASPIQNMLSIAFSFIPHLIGAIILVALAIFVGKFVRNLVYNLALTLKIDRWVRKFTGQKSEVADEIDRQTDTIATVLANIVYVLILIPIITVALETLGIQSISEPIIHVLNAIMAAIPHVLVAIILLTVGIALAKFVGSIVTDLLRGTGINNLTQNMANQSFGTIDLAKISGQAVSVLIGLFFFVEALNALNLSVLNAIGAAVIAYLPNVLFASIILGLGVIGGQWVGNFIGQTSGSKWTGAIIQYVIMAFSLFMVLDQLNFASTIVNTGFMFIIGGLSVAFALAFGLGGRRFAEKQLQKLDDKVDKEAQK